MLFLALGIFIQFYVGIIPNKKTDLLPDNPTIVSINGKQWYIWNVDDLGQGFFDHLKDRKAVAATDCENFQIIYSYTLGHRDLRNTLWHEIFHAGACPHDASYWNSKSDKDEEHEGIQHLADFIENFTRANPEFTKWEMQ